MPLPISKEQKKEIIHSIRRFFSEKLELELSQVQAGFLLEYFLHEIAPLAYNQGCRGLAEVSDPPGRGLTGILLSGAPDVLERARQFARRPSQATGLAVLSLPLAMPNQTTQPTAGRCDYQLTTPLTKSGPRKDHRGVDLISDALLFCSA
jgi:uncharacterized protein (DUF2164 family)